MTPMQNLKLLPVKIQFLMVCMILISACSTPLPASPTGTGVQPIITTMIPSETPIQPSATPTSTETPTNTPTVTPTIEPTSTATEAPTSTPTETPTNVPQQGGAPFGLLKYLVLIGSGGPDGCGDTAVPVSIGILPTGDVRENVKLVLNNLLASGVKYEGNLYNATYQSKLRVERIEFIKNSGKMNVFLVGSFVKPKDDCDKKRYHAQVWETVYQFPEVKRVDFWVNRLLLGDLLVVGDN